MLLSYESKIKPGDLLNEVSGRDGQRANQALRLTVSQGDQENHKISRGLLPLLPLPTAQLEVHLTINVYK